MRITGFCAVLQDGFHRPPFPKGGGGIDGPLVAGAAKAEIQGFLRLEKGAVDEDIGLPKQFLPAGVSLQAGKQLFDGIAGVGDDAFAQGVNLTGQPGQGSGLKKGLPAGEGDARQQRVFAEFPQQGLRVSGIAAGRIMGGRIVAAGTAVGATLGEHDEADAGAVHDGFPDDACQLKL